MADKNELSQVESATSAGYGPQTIDPVAEKRTVRRLDWNLMPLVMALYLLSFVDRSNIGNANTAGMSKELKISDPQYQWLLTIFYIPYILFEWFALMWKILPPHLWAAVTVLIWGIASTLQAAAQNWSGMMACRFFLAVAEAGYGPGLPYFLSFFYNRDEIGLRCGIFLSAAPFATCFAGALAYGITSGHPALASWRVLFLAEGLPSIAMAAVAYFIMPDSPQKARFLTTEQKEIARRRSIRQTGMEGDDRIGHINWADIRTGLADPRNWLTALMYFSCNVSFSSLPVFLPAILKSMGYSSINAQGLTAPPYFLSGCICIFSTWVADRTKQRGLVIAFLSVVGGVGYILLSTEHSTAVRYVGVFFAAAGIFPAISNILPWVLNNQGNDTKRGVGMAMLQMIGQCGPILGTRLYPKTEAPYYVKGMSICAAFMFFNALLALVLRTYLSYLNKKADQAEASVGAAVVDEKTGHVAVENDGVGWRNIL